MKICWFTNIPSPYKTELFNLLNQKVELFVVYEQHNEKDREDSWISSGPLPYQCAWLTDHDHRLPQVLADHYDLFVNGDYSSRQAASFVKSFHRLSKPVVMQADGGLVIKRPLIDPVIRHVINQNDWFLSSGIETDRYYDYYHVPENRLKHYRFSSLTREDLRQHSSMSQKKAQFYQECGYSEPFIIFSAGQQIPRKGYDILVKAAAGLSPNIGIYIAGGNPEEAVMKEITEQHLNHIHFVGFKTKTELASYYAGADLFVLPTRYDIWGLVINEALSFGLPVISTDHCVAALEFSHLGSAVQIVKSEDVPALHQAISTLYSNPDLRSKMHDSGLQIIQNYTIENSCSTMLKAFQEVLG